MVTNVAAFGAFVDIGVHQDGLVHVSALANKFVKDPHDVVKPGQIVKVKVLEVDVKRQRVALTMRLDDVAGDRSAPRRSDATAPKAATRAGAGVRDNRGGQGAGAKRPSAAETGSRQPQGESAMALAFAQLKKSS